MHSFAFYRLVCLAGTFLDHSTFLVACMFDRSDPPGTAARDIYLGSTVVYSLAKHGIIRFENVSTRLSDS